MDIAVILCCGQNTRNRCAVTVFVTERASAGSDISRLRMDPPCKFMAVRVNARIDHTDGNTRACRPSLIRGHCVMKAGAVRPVKLGGLEAANRRSRRRRRRGRRRWGWRDHRWRRRSRNRVYPPASATTAARRQAKCKDDGRANRQFASRNSVRHRRVPSFNGRLMCAMKAFASLNAILTLL